MKTDNIILFGSGYICSLLLEILPAEKIEAIADNKRGGEDINGSTILDFEDYLKITGEAITIISTRLEYALDIASQFEENGIHDFLYWAEIVSKYDDVCHQEARAFRSKYSNKQAHDMVEAVKSLTEGLFRRCENSQVEFYFVDYFELSHYLPLYTGLKARGINAVMVCEPRIINKKKLFNYHDTIGLLEDKNIPYYTLSNPDAHVAVTTQFADNLCQYKNRKCHIAYGTSLMRGKAFILDKRNSEKFDLVLTNGDFYKEMIEEYVPGHNVVSVSYPRYADFFESPPDKGKIFSELGINTDKKILLYLPTYDDGSSIQEYADALASLRSRYFIISKPHHCTFYRDDKKKDLQRLYEISDIVVHALYLLSNIAIIGELAICDAKSGVMNEVSFLNSEIKKIAVFSNTDVNDFYIDPRQFVYCAFSPQEMLQGVNDMEAGDTFIEERKKYTDYFYSVDVASGLEKGINAIIERI